MSFSIDLLSKRILAISLGITMMLLAASVFVFTTQKAIAKTPEKTTFKPNYADYYWVQIHGDNVYYFNNGKLGYEPLSAARRVW